MSKLKKKLDEVDMHEISLSIFPVDKTDSKKRVYRPVGSPISVISKWRKRAKWIEIICDLASPKKRGALGSALVQNNNWPTFRWNRICQAWTPQLRRLWRDWDLGAPDTDDPLGLAMRRQTARELWNTYIKPTGVISEAGKDPTNMVDLTDTWLWSNSDRRKSLVIVSDDMTELDLEDATKREQSTVDDKQFIKPRKIIDWVNDLDLTVAEKADIYNPSKRVQPRFDKLILRDKLKTTTNPSISLVKKVEARL